MKTCLLLMFVTFVFFQSRCDSGKMTNANKSPVNKAMENREIDTPKFDKLPDGITPETKVRKDVVNEKGEVVSYKQITVKEKLTEVGAKYENEKLVDRGGKEIKFYTPPVRGISQGFEEDEKQRERDKQELNELKSKYTIIILYVDLKKVS